MTSPALAGTITVVFLVAFGLFVYPLLLKRRGGFAIVAALTVALAALFYAFDLGTGTERSTSLVLGVVWALLPMATGLVVWMLQRKRTAHTGGT